MNLYKFEKDKCSNPGAPRMVPVNSSGVARSSNNFIGKDSLLNSSPGVVDVVNNFQWTTSPPGPRSRQEVPRIELREKKLRTNSVVAAAAYYLMSASGSVGTLAARANNLLPTGLKEAGLGFLSGLGSSAPIQYAGNGLLNFFEQNVLQSALTLTTGQTDIRQTLSKYVDGLNSEYLRVYEGLYITEDTKFVYYLPYFENMCNAVANEFTENDSSDIGKKGVNEMRDAAEALARFANFSAPGVYIERPKFYNFANSGPKVTVKFPLINTGWSSYQDVRLNWQLVFMLIYQNRPNRKSRELIDPACIYEVVIPGVLYMPYAFMSSIKVDFLGARRQMDLDVPLVAGNSTITTIVPEAYSVEIELTGLIAESQNLLISMLQDKQDIVNVYGLDQFNPFAESYNNLATSFANETARLNTST
jgi:hypothetical protein